MQGPAHDTLADLGRGTPALFLWSARLLPVTLGAQFLLAGQALFGGLSWDLHGLLGGLVGLPVVALLAASLCIARLRGFGWWAALTAALYGLQLGLAAASPVALSFHPFNGALLLTAALVLLFKVERRHAHPL